MSNLEALRRAFQAMLAVTGKRMATAPVVLMKAESMATTTMMMISSLTSLVPAIRLKRLPTISATPVCTNPLPTTKSAATMSTTEFEKPASASAGVSRPVNISAMIVNSATISRRIHSLMNRAIAPARIPNTSNISDDMYQSLERPVYAAF